MTRWYMHRNCIVYVHAIYCAQVYLLDDPLAAVDGHVAAWLIEHVLGPRGLLGGKLRLVATSQLEVARDASQIVVLRDGEVREDGLQPYVLQAATRC